MYTETKRPKEKEKDRVRLSFSSWILGGPIVQPVMNTRRRSSSGRKLVVDSGNEGNVKRRSTVGGEKAAEKPKKEEEKSEEKKSEEKKSEEKKSEEKKSKEKKSEKKATEEKPADDKPADEKPAEEKKMEDEVKAKEKEDGKKQNGGKEFTAEQDGEIVKLKKEGKTWREVATAVKRSQKDCQTRLKELEKGEEKESEGGTKDDDAADPDPASEEEEEEEEEEEKKKKEDKKGNKAEDASAKTLKADDIWTKDDCKVLEMLEVRYREQKWLQIQASFYNHTGRMVIADLIEKKFQDG